MSADKTPAVVFHADEWPATVHDRLGFVPVPGSEWSVWNAPRPLLGSHAWTGPFRRGIHYAAVRRDDDSHEWCEQQNLRDDAARVELITDGEILAAVRAYAEDHGYTVEMCADLGIDLKDLANELGLPWLDSTTEAAR